MKENTEIEKILSARGITDLIHFSRIENLPGILESGIRPRAVLNGEKVIFNDANRFDNCTEAVCTTIAFPNYKMFYALRMASPNAKWVVFVIDAQAMVDFKCAFCEMNAGSRKMFTMSLEERMGAGALQNLFKEESDGRKRADLDIPKHYPTNPQAEILVFDTIPVRYIRKIIFEDYRTFTKAKTTYKDRIPFGTNIYVNRGYFAPRRDYEKWK